MKWQKLKSETSKKWRTVFIDFIEINEYTNYNLLILNTSMHFLNAKIILKTCFCYEKKRKKRKCTVWFVQYQYDEWQWKTVVKQLNMY